MLGNVCRSVEMQNYLTVVRLVSLISFAALLKHSIRYHIIPSVFHQNLMNFSFLFCFFYLIELLAKEQLQHCIKWLDQGYQWSNIHLVLQKQNSTFQRMVNSSWKDMPFWNNPGHFRHLAGELKGARTVNDLDTFYHQEHSLHCTVCNWIVGEKLDSV